VPIQNPANAPEDLVFSCFGHRPYFTPQHGIKDKISRCYFHLDVSCLTNFDDRIQPTDITMEVEDYLNLTEEHLKHLAQEELLLLIRANIPSEEGKHTYWSLPESSELLINSLDL
jgi:hypothetical protein